MQSSEVMYTAITSSCVRITAIAAITGGAMLLAAKPANAQQFGEAKTFTVAVERLSGFVHTVNSEDTDNTTETVTSNTFTLLPFDGNQLTTYSKPRLAFDYFVIKGLSLGGSFGFGVFSRKQKTQAGNASVEVETLDATGFAIAPRIGYAVMFSRTLGIWPRGGITYIKTNAASNLEVSALALTAEVPLVIAPTRNIDILIAPTFDLGLSGSVEVSNGNVTASRDFKTNEFGIQAGLGVYF